MKNKYTDVMKEIRLSDESKQRIINNIRNKNNDGKFKGLKKLIAFSSISIAIIFLFAIFSMLNINGNHVLSNIVITAYAEENNQFTIKPNVNFMIDIYSSTMNSVPGMPIKINCEDAKSIKLTVKNGSLLKWNQVDGTVKSLGKYADINSGEIIYWSPFNDSNENIANDNISISITNDKGQKSISNIEITENDCKCSYKGIYKN
jgi:hypothetical protein